MTGATAGKRLRWLDVATMASGMPLRLPVHEVVGARPGPTFGLSAAIHGDEVAPIEVVRRIVTEIDPARLKGRLVAMPVVNPLALEDVSRNTPLDRHNLNRVFPGDAGGWITERIAHVVSQEFVPGLDYLVDLHAGGVFPTVDYVYVRNDEGLSRAFGFPVLFRSNANVGSLSDVAQARGTKSAVIELGGGLIREDEYIERGVRGVYNTMRYAGLLDGEPEPPPAQTVVRQLATIRPRHGGLLQPEVRIDRINQEIPGGTLLGRVISPYTFETLEEIRAPYRRSLVILLRASLSRVNPGDYAYMIGDLETAET